MDVAWMSFANAAVRAPLALAVLSTFIVIAPVTAAPGRVGPPIAYGQWTATQDASGKAVINDSSTECATTGWKCKLIAQDDGFLYEEVHTADGEVYTRMIMTDRGSSGDASTLPFSNEIYTTMLERPAGSGDWVFAPDATTVGLAAQGVAARQIVRDAALSTTVEIQNGFARAVMGTNDGLSTYPDPVADWCRNNDPTNPTCAQDIAEQAFSVKIEQDLVDPELDAGFNLVLYHDVNSQPSGGATGPVGGIQSNRERGRIMDLVQSVRDLSTGETQTFDKRVRIGRAGYEWSCDPNGGFPGLIDPCRYEITAGGSLALGGGSVAWNQGGGIDATWIGSVMGLNQFAMTVAAGSNLQWSGGSGPFGAWTDPSYSFVDTGKAREVVLDKPPAAPAGWPSDPFADLNWPTGGNLVDPFATTAPRTAAPTL